MDPICFSLTTRVVELVRTDVNKTDHVTVIRTGKTSFEKKKNVTKITVNTVVLITTYWSNTIASLRLVCVLANLRARSLASDPELTKKQTFSCGGRDLVSRSAYRTRLSCKKREFVFNSLSCL